MDKGSLYIVATPIGNLSDITLRALEVLKDVDLIISEDTRETDKVLKKYQILKPQLSYRDQNHKVMFPKVTSMLEIGKSVALISDSGTPLISDPGFKLVRDLIQQDFNVISIPGPSAVISALVSSGFPTDKFSFVGFMPKSKGERKKILQNFGSQDATLIIYESPFRILKLLEEIILSLGNREVCLANELTKLHEKFIRGKAEDLLSVEYHRSGEYGRKKVTAKQIKGEFVVLVAKEDFSL
jgi:16S rRNA (cytidine1402-2'-O)-methyltransferase